MPTWRKRTVRSGEVEKWRFTGIYGESKYGEKEKTWRLLRNLHAQSSSLPWLYVGDFNDILFDVEREGGPTRAQGCMDAFRNCLEICALDDLGFTGDPFTWQSNWHDVSGYTRERLDRDVANVAWRSMFPLHRVINGNPRHSDHRPVIIELNTQDLNGEKRSEPSYFRFEAKWLQEEDYVQIV